MSNNINSTRLKFVFYKPHANIWFKNTVRNMLKGQHIPNKYAPLFDYVVNSDADIYFTTALLYDVGIKGFISSVFDAIELLFWCYLNKISLRKVDLIFKKDSLRGKDVLFMMHYGSFTYENRQASVRCARLAEYLSDVNIYKIVHMTHFAYNPSVGFENLKKLSPDLLVAENNLSVSSPFFIKYFANLDCKFYQLPYTPANRFVRKTPFNERLNKIVATGSITYKMRSSDFIEFYGVDELQPLRRELYETSSKYSSELDSLISDLNASRLNESRVKKSGLIESLLKRAVSKHPQLSYYRQDIVATYNAYTMFTVPEELCNLPAIGFVEGMACGCVFLGIDDPMYRDIGMVPNVHYVAYDGSVSDLMEKVRYYQKNIEELEVIANAGYGFVNGNLNSNVVYKAFFDQISSNLESRHT